MISLLLLCDDFDINITNRSIEIIPTKIIPAPKVVLSPL